MEIRRLSTESDEFLFFDETTLHIFPIESTESDEFLFIDETTLHIFRIVGTPFSRCVYVSLCVSIYVFGTVCRKRMLPTSYNYEQITSNIATAIPVELTCPVFS